jgi:hypothetical protein
MLRDRRVAVGFSTSSLLDLDIRAKAQKVRGIQGIQELVPV